MQVRDDRVDAMITKLLEVRGKKPGKNMQLSAEDIQHLCQRSRELFISQPNLLELEAPIKICGKFLHPFACGSHFDKNVQNATRYKSIFATHMTTCLVHVPLYPCHPMTST